jgi:hypothetical protein
MIEVRRAVPADAEAITEVARATWDVVYADIILAENRVRLLSRWYAPTTLQNSMAREGSWFFVALADDKLVGFAQFILHADSA